MQHTQNEPDAELMLWGRPADLHPLKLQVLPPDPPSAPRRNRTLRLVEALGRRRTLFFTIIVVCSLAAGLVELSRPAFYTASAALQVSLPANAETVAHLAEARQLWKEPARAAGLAQLREYRWSMQGLLRDMTGGTAADINADVDAQLTRHLTLTPAAQGRVLQVHFRSSDPNRAAAFLNLLVAAIAHNVTEMRLVGVEGVRSTFAGQIAYARAQYQALEDDLLVMTRVAAMTGHLPEAPASGNPARSEAALRFEAKRRELESRRIAYEDLLRQERAAEYGAASDGDVRPIAAANVIPAPRLGWLIAALSGAALAFLVAVPLCLLRDATDPVVRYAADVADQTGTVLLGVIPHALIRRRRRGSVIDLNGGAGGETELTAPGLAEAFRHLLTSVWIAGQKHKRPRVLLVTSASAKDGKTTIVANLGVALANSRRRVLLVDADLRKPRLHTMFSANANWGLANVLEQDAPLEDYDFDELYIKTDVPGLYILPAGTGSLAIADLKNVERLTELLMRARLEFHAVLIDTPGAVTFPETRVVAKLADSVILVVRANATRRARVSGLARQFADDGAAVLGAVLNDSRRAR